MKFECLIWTALALAALGLNACGGPSSYTSEPFDAQVVDANTGQPIAGALVFAHWHLRKAQTLDTPGFVGELEVMETVTDNEGRFHIAGFTKANPGHHLLWDEDPEIIIYKPGYALDSFDSSYPVDQHLNLPAKRKSRLAGQTLKLKPWSGDDRLKATYLGGIDSRLNEVVRSCMWTRAPRFIAALAEEGKRLDERNPSLIFSSTRLEELPKNCGTNPGELKGKKQ